MSRIAKVALKPTPIEGWLGLVHSEKLGELSVLGISCVIALVGFLFCEPVAPSDANTYLNYSIQISLFQVSPANFFRTCGYPLLLTASLYPWTQSVVGILAIQALFGAAIPWYVFRTFELVSHKFSVFAGIASALVLLPYNFQNLIYPDKSQLFFMVLFNFQLVRFVSRPSRRGMAFSFLSYACLSLLRPTFIALYPLLLLSTVATVLLNRTRKSWIRYLKPFAVFSLSIIALYSAIAILDQHLYASIGAKKGLVCRPSDLL